MNVSLAKGLATPSLQFNPVVHTLLMRQAHRASSPARNTVCRILPKGGLAHLDKVYPQTRALLPAVRPSPNNHSHHP